MSMSNKSMGNHFESDLCEILSKYGFWVHRLSENKVGQQPADVIAVKNQKAFLIDCKVCENDRFPFFRIEPNQHTSMTLWKQCGNGFGLFALRLTDGKIYFLDHELMTALSARQSSINRENIERYGTPIERWVKECM